MSLLSSGPTNHSILHSTVLVVFQKSLPCLKTSVFLVSHRIKSKLHNQVYKLLTSSSNLPVADSWLLSLLPGSLGVSMLNSSSPYSDQVRPLAASAALSRESSSPACLPGKHLLTNAVFPSTVNPSRILSPSPHPHPPTPSPRSHSPGAS